MTLTDMTLPDEVVRETGKAIKKTYDTGVFVTSDDPMDRFDALARPAIRAALQAMCDCGMASISTHTPPRVPPLYHFQQGFPALIIRMDGNG